MEMRRVTGFIFPGFELLDLFGPLQMFGLLKETFELRLVAEEPGAVPGNPGAHAHATHGLEGAEGTDILLIPGGPGTRGVATPALLEWVKATSDTAKLTLSVCTGSAILARAGVLDNRRATTNKAAFDWVAAQGPKVDWQKEARWVEDGDIFTSSGVSAGMDMALAVIARLEGEAAADQVATWAEYRRETDAGNDPFARIHGLV